MNAIEDFLVIIKLLLIHFYESLIAFNGYAWLGIILIFCILYSVISEKSTKEIEEEEEERHKKEKEHSEYQIEEEERHKKEKENSAYFFEEEERHKKEKEEWEKIQRERPLFVERDSLDKAVDLYVRNSFGWKIMMAEDNEDLLKDGVALTDVEEHVEKRKLEIINELREDPNLQIEEERIVSILADYLDAFKHYGNFNYYHEMLRNFPSIVTDAAEKVHIPQHQNYIQHLKFVKENAIARKVEIAKIKKDRKNPYSVRYENYEKALRMLEKD